MNTTIRFLLILALVIPTSIYAQEKDIPARPDSIDVQVNYPFAERDDNSRGYYGSDDRMDVTRVSGYSDLTKATVVMVKKSQIRGNRIYSKSLRDRLVGIYGVNRFHENVKFLDQPTCGSCTGFLISPSIVGTAGHCTEIKNMCEDYVWVFDYTNSLYFNDNQDYVVIDPNNVYECDEILTSVLNDNEMSDFGFVRLNRETDRTPYTFRTSGKIKLYQEVFMIGAPTGLPLKLASNAYVYGTLNSHHFKTSLDAFPGNSGGPVFDKSGFLEGILVRGDVTSDWEGSASGDYIYDMNCRCIKTVNFLSTYNKHGAEVQRIDWCDYSILKTAIYENIKYAIEHSDMNRLNTWLEYTWMIENDLTVSKGRFEWIAIKQNNYEALKAILALSENKDIKDNYGRNLVYQAIKNNDTEMVRELFAEGLSMNEGDEFGESAIHWAIDQQNAEVLRTVLELGGKNDINTVVFGNSPLHRAVGLDNTEIAGILIDNGADLKLKNMDGCTPYRYAKDLKLKEMRRFIKRKKKEMN